MRKRFDLDFEILSYVVQAVVQIAWGVICWLNSPHHILLTLVNGALFVLAVACMFSDDKELWFRRLYMAIWVVPVTYAVLASLASLLDFYKAAGFNSADLPVQGSSGDYWVALGYYLVSQAIPLLFEGVRWIESRRHGRSR